MSPQEGRKRTSRFSRRHRVPLPFGSAIMNLAKSISTSFSFVELNFDFKLLKLFCIFANGDRGNLNDRATQLDATRFDVYEHDPGNAFFADSLRQ